MGYVKSINSLAFNVNDNVGHIFLHCELCCELFRRPQANMQARAPDEGPSGVRSSASETSSQLASQNVGVEERCDPKLLRAIVKKNNIDSTRSLVAAYNATTDDNERAVLLGWLSKYHERREDCLTPKTVLEYAELVNIAPRSISEQDIIKNLFDDLCSCIPEGRFLTPSFAAALYKALVHVDPSVYGGVAELVVVTRKLLGSLSARPKLERENFWVYRKSFLTLQQTLYLLQKSNQSGIEEDTKQKIRQALAKKERDLEQSCKYYPVKFCFQALRQAVKRLGVKDTSRIAKAARCIRCGILVVYCVDSFLRKCARADIDPEGIEKAFKKARDAVNDMMESNADKKESKRPWFDSLWNLMEARMEEAAKNEMKLDFLVSVSSITIENQRRMENGEDLKALRFGIIDELGMLAIEGWSESTRREATIMLADMTTQQAISEGWIRDDDILIALLDVIHEVHKTGQCIEKTEEALTALHRYSESSASDAMMAWLDGRSMEEKLAARSPQKTRLEHKELLTKTGRDVGRAISIREDLKEMYLCDNFATVPSLFGSEVRGHVKDMEHHVIVYEEIIEERRNEGREKQREEEGDVTEGESSTNHGGDNPNEYCKQKRKVATPVSMENLFTVRSLESGAGKSEIRRVLLHGNPGSGKTCLAKVVAHRWALGEMFQESKAIFVVPIRRLNLANVEGVRGKALEEMVTHVCFEQKRNDAEFEELNTQVNDALDMSSTLLIFDGLEEADDNAREILSEAKKRACRILILARPYNLRGIQTEVDCQFECLGFNDRHLRNYINKELQEHEASRLVYSLQQERGLWETAQTPVMAHILCSLSKKHGTSSKDRGKRASTLQIYNDVTGFVWKRFQERPKARTANKNVLFEDLEKIAFEALKNGQVLVERRTIERHVTTTNTLEFFKESGFLLLVQEGEQYQFPRFIFQEFFAGKFIARSLNNKRSDEERRVIKFIQEEKYNQKNALTLSFAMHAFAEGRGKLAFRELLSIVDEQPIEVLGIQHFLLRMRVLEAALEEATEDDLEDLLDDEKATKLVGTVRQLLERTPNDVLIRNIVVDEFQRLHRVLENFPQVFDGVIEEAKKPLECTHELSRMDMAKIKNVLQLIKNFPKQSDMIVQLVLQRAEEPDNWCNATERIRRFELIAEQLPQHNGDLLTMLGSQCFDEESDVRLAAMKAVGHVVEAVPAQADEVLQMFGRGCSDEDSNVRLAAMTAFGHVVKAVPKHADEVLQIFVKGCSDEDSDVRLAAIRAVGYVVEASPHFAGDHLEMLERWCNDENWSVRWQALATIIAIVDDSPQVLSELLPMLKTRCADKNFFVRQNATENIGKAFKEKQDLASQPLPILESRCNDQDFFVRQSAIEAVCDVVIAMPHLAGGLLNLLKRGCSDNVYFVRWTAIGAVGKVVGAMPHLTDELLPILEEGSSDKDFFVRLKAIEAVGLSLGAAPQLVNELMPMLERGCLDENSDVRRQTLNAVGAALGAALGAAPQLANELMPLLWRGCLDENSDVRRQTLNAVGAALSAAPQLANELMPLLERGCVDEHSDVRWHALKAVGAASHLVGELMPLLERGRMDEHSDVRSNALKAIGEVVKTVLRLTGEMLPMSEKQYRNEHLFVHRTPKTTSSELRLNRVISQTSISALKKNLLIIFIRNPFTLDPQTRDKKVSFVLHAVSSHEIGGWDGETLDRCLKHLRKEFEEKFPGLFEKVTIKE